MGPWYGGCLGLIIACCIMVLVVVFFLYVPWFKEYPVLPVDEECRNNLASNAMTATLLASLCSALGAAALVELLHNNGKERPVKS